GLLAANVNDGVRLLYYDTLSDVLMGVGGYRIILSRQPAGTVNLRRVAAIMAVNSRAGIFFWILAGVITLGLAGCAPGGDSVATATQIVFPSPTASPQPPSPTVAPTATVAPIATESPT